MPEWSFRLLIIYCIGKGFFLNSFFLRINRGNRLFEMANGDSGARILFLAFVIGKFKGEKGLSKDRIHI